MLSATSGYASDGEFQIVALWESGAGRVVESRTGHGFQSEPAPRGATPFSTLARNSSRGRWLEQGSRAEQSARRDDGGGQTMQMNVGTPRGGQGTPDGAKLGGSEITISHCSFGERLRGETPAHPWREIGRVPATVG